MKKSLIALAALGAMAGAAHAQSTVTLYGLVDAYFGRTSTEVTGAAPVGKLTQTAVNSSGLNNSRWGFKGSEDLGGGLKANFTLEQGFSVDSGAAVSSTLQFSRKATVGLSGGFGAVDLGRQYGAYDDLRGATNMIYDSNFATTGTVWANGLKDYTNRIDNSIGYRSPSFGGFSGAVVIGLGENKELAPTNLGDATNIVSLNVKYANGPLQVGYAYQEEKQAQPSLLVAQDKNTYHLIAGSFDFGMAKVTGGYNQAKNDTDLKDKEYQLGVSVPFGAAAVAAGYSHSVSEIDGQSDLTGRGVSIVGTYDLSKRTTLYAGYLGTKVEANRAAISTTEKTTFATGVRHTF